MQTSLEVTTRELNNCVCVCVCVCVWGGGGGGGGGGGQYVCVAHAVQCYTSLN